MAPDAGTDAPAPSETAGPRIPLAAAAVGAYALLITGATVGIADAAAACGGWPVCTATGTEPLLLIAWAHRLATVAVGGLLVWAAWRTWIDGSSARIRGATLAAAAAYPVQIWLGAVVSTGGASPVPGLHLAIGAGIVGALTAALAWSFDPADELTDDRPPAERSRHADAAAESPDSEAPFPTLRAYVAMTKPRLMWLLCLVALAAIALTGRLAALDIVGRTLLGGVLAIGASGTFNHVLERDRDRKMQRTSDRPLAADRVPVTHATAFGLALAAAATATFLSLNVLAAVLGVVAILFYSVVYTLVLKPNTVQNTVLGGAAGALPALIGWAAVTEGLALPAFLLAAVIFLWTPAHFYNLAMAYREDYARGGFPMLPVVRGGAVARRHVVYYLGATLVASAALTTVAALGPVYAGATILGAAVFVAAVVRLDRQLTRRTALQAFHASNAFLGLTLVAIVLDAGLL
jgi:protoheme IX farnesyltransferase